MIMMMGTDTDFEGIYIVRNKDNQYGLMQILDHYCDCPEDDIGTDGQWYYDLRIGDDMDGGMCGYNTGDTFRRLEDFAGVEIVGRIASLDISGYDNLLDWITGAQNDRHPLLQGQQEQEPWAPHQRPQHRAPGPRYTHSHPRPHTRGRVPQTDPTRRMGGIE